MKKLLLPVLIIAVCLTYFIATPFITSYKIVSAVKKGDDAELSSYIDYPMLKQNLKRQIEAKIAEKFQPQSDNTLITAITNFGKKMLTPTVDTLVTPKNVRLILQTGAISTTLLDADEEGSEDNKDKENTLLEDLDKKLDFHYINKDEFKVTIHNSNTNVILQRQGLLTWKVTNIILGDSKKIGNINE